MKVHEIMTAHVRSVRPDNTLVEAAGLMREFDVGSLPVCDGENGSVLGMVTDRDFVLRGVAKGCDVATATVQDVMSTGAIFILADQEVEEAVRVMESRQIRRLPVLNHSKRLVGIISLGDIAITSNPAFSGLVLRDVSQPANPSARQQRLAAKSGSSGTGAEARRLMSESRRTEAVPGSQPTTDGGNSERAAATRSPRSAAPKSKSSPRASGAKRETAVKKGARGGKKTATRSAPAKRSKRRSVSA